MLIGSFNLTSLKSFLIYFKLSIQFTKIHIRYLLLILLLTLSNFIAILIILMYKYKLAC